MKQISRQRLWQIEQGKQGNCQKCGKPSPDKVHCDACAARKGTKRRRMTPAEWAAIDWTESNLTISKRLGRTWTAVNIQRKKAGAPPVPHDPIKEYLRAQTPEPEARKILLTTVHAAREALATGIENTQELLTQHDAELGRTTRSNRMNAERLEQEIVAMQTAREALHPNSDAP